MYTRTFRLLLRALPIAVLICSCTTNKQTDLSGTIVDNLIACNVLDADDRDVMTQHLEDESPTTVIGALISVQYGKLGVEGDNSFRTTTIIYDTTKYSPEQMAVAVEGVKRFWTAFTPAR